MVGKLIRKYGCRQVLDPSVKKGCEEIAAFIADKDKTVRDSALNVITSAYHDIGDDIYKFAGKVSFVVVSIRGFEFTAVMICVCTLLLFKLSLEVFSG